MCLGVPHVSADLRARLVQIDDRFDGLTGRFPREETYWAELVRSAAQRTVAILWNGNQHYGRFLLEENPPIDLILPEEPHLPLDPRARVVPVLLLQELWKSTFDELLPIIDKLKDLDGCRPILVGTPPPVRTDASIWDALRRRDQFPVQVGGYFNIDLATAKPTSPIVMYKLWVTIQLSIREIAARYRIPYCPVPAAVQTDNGLLRDEYSQTVDFTHANDAYGALMRDHLFAFVFGSGASNASL